MGLDRPFIGRSVEEDNVELENRACQLILWSFTCWLLFSDDIIKRISQIFQQRGTSGPGIQHNLFQASPGAFGFRNPNSNRNCFLVYCFGFFGEAFAAQLFQFVQVLRLFASLSWSLWVEQWAVQADCNFFGVQTLKVPPLCCLISSVLFKKMLPAPHLWLYITNHALFLPCFNCLTVLRGYYMTKIHPSILSTLYLLYKLGLSIDILCGIDRRRLLIFLSDIVPTIRQVNHWFVKNSGLRIRSFFFFAGGSPLDFDRFDGLAPKTSVPKTVTFWVWFSAVWIFPSSKHFWFPLKRSSLRCNKSATAT